MEDALIIDYEKNLFAIADGVTRIYYRIKDFSEGSGSSKAARIFCDSVIKYLKNNLICDSDNLSRAFIFANNQIRKLNQQAGILKRLDYLEHDYYGTVGAAAFICDKGHLHYGYIADCRIIVFNSDWGTRLETPDEVSIMKMLLHQTSCEDLLKDHVFVHTNLRNNLYKFDAIESKIGYGVFTGEKKVVGFFRIGEIEIQNGDFVCIFTDGFSPIIDHPNFLAIIKKLCLHFDSRRAYSEINRLCEYLSGIDSNKYGDDKVFIFLRI